MTAHDATPTPGPWFATYHGDKFSDDGPGFWLIDAVPAPNQETAIAEICSKPGDRSEANARLIASAPALAEENARLVVILQEIRSWCAEEENSGPLADPMETVREIRSFIHAALAPKEPEV